MLQTALLANTISRKVFIEFEFKIFFTRIIKLLFFLGKLTIKNNGFASDYLEY